MKMILKMVFQAESVKDQNKSVHSSASHTSSEFLLRMRTKVSGHVNDEVKGLRLE